MSRLTYGHVTCDTCDTDAEISTLVPFSVEPGSMDLSDLDLEYDGPDEWRSTYDAFGTRFDYCSSACEHGEPRVPSVRVAAARAAVIAAARACVVPDGTDLFGIRRLGVLAAAVAALDLAEGKMTA